MLFRFSLAIIFFAYPTVHAQTIAASGANIPRQNTAWFFDASDLPLANVLPSPPQPGSDEQSKDLAEVHHIESNRTPADIRAAQYDDTHEDIFIFASVLGKDFNGKNLPATAALSAHLRHDAGLVDNPLKQKFNRLRPYNFDHTLHPVCETNQEPSYPSGHSINGYLYAFSLAEMIPERRDAILHRADEYAHNRVVCGSHFVTDVEASRQVASFMFGYLLATPRYRQELNAATRETRDHLHLSDPPMKR